MSTASAITSPDITICSVISGLLWNASNRIAGLFRGFYYYVFYYFYGIKTHN